MLEVEELDDVLDELLEEEADEAPLLDDDEDEDDGPSHPIKAARTMLQKAVRSTLIELP